MVHLYANGTIISGQEKGQMGQSLVDGGSMFILLYIPVDLGNVILTPSKTQAGKDIWMPLPKGPRQRRIKLV